MILESSRDNLGRFLPGTHWRPPGVFRARDYLVREYIESNRSSADIAREHGVTEGAIIFWLRRHAIPRRSVSQARRVKYWGASGEANPMFGRTGALNPRYIDGSSPERQTMYARTAWKSVATEALRRDGYRCRRCATGHTKDTALVVHHIRPWAGNPGLRLALDNLATLCAPCHRWIHSKRNAGREWLA